MGRVFANGPGDRGSISGHVIPKTLKMVLDTSWLNTQQNKIRIPDKVEQSRERSSAFPLHLGVVAIEKGAFWSPSTTVTIFTYFISISAFIRLCTCRPCKVLFLGVCHRLSPCFLFLYLRFCCLCSFISNFHFFQ